MAALWFLTDSGWGTTDEGSAPSAPVLVSAIVSGSTTAAFQWTVVANATSYSVEINPNSSGWIPAVGTLSGTTFLAVSLLAATQYAWRVTATNSLGSATSTPGTFVTDNPGNGGGSIDIVAPTFAGGAVITNTTPTATSYSATCAVGSDDVGVTGYQYRIDAGSWVTISGGSRTADITGRTPSSTDSFDMRCFDAAGNFSAVLSTTIDLPAAPGATFTGPLTFSNVTDTGYTVTYPPASDSESTYEYITDGSAFASNGTALSFAVTGKTPGSISSVSVRARYSSGNTSAYITDEVTLLQQIGLTAPSALAILNRTSTGYRITFLGSVGNYLSWYEYSINGAAWIAASTALYVDVSGRPPLSTDTFRIRGVDNTHSVASPIATIEVTTLAASILPSPSRTYKVPLSAPITAVNKYPVTWYKDSGDVIDFSVDWTDWLNECNDSYLSCAITPDANSGISVSNEMAIAGDVMGLFSGGDIGTWVIEFRIDTLYGRTDLQYIKIEVQ